MNYSCNCVGIMEFVLVEKGISLKNFTDFLSRHIFFFEAVNKRKLASSSSTRKWCFNSVEK